MFFRWFALPGASQIIIFKLKKLWNFAPSFSFGCSRPTDSQILPAALSAEIFGLIGSGRLSIQTRKIPEYQTSLRCFSPFPSIGKIWKKFSKILQEKSMQTVSLDFRFDAILSLKKNIKVFHVTRLDTTLPITVETEIWFIWMAILRKLGRPSSHRKCVYFEEMLMQEI